MAAASFLYPDILNGDKKYVYGHNCVSVKYRIFYVKKRRRKEFENIENFIKILVDICSVEW